jgi:uncharacterized NAD(P)/FAD-binding protein YdhS
MDIAKILTVKMPGSEWSLSGDNYDGLVWLSNTTKPTLEQIQSWDSEVKTILENENRIWELKSFLADSDFRMTKDYFESMSTTDQNKWISQRLVWRSELRRLNEGT